MDFLLSWYFRKSIIKPEKVDKSIDLNIDTEDIKFLKMLRVFRKL